MKRIFESFLVLSLLSASAFAEDIAVVGGTAYTDGGKGKVENATVLISDGKIAGVSAGGPVPDGYRVLDATGRWVTPGLMVAASNLGLVEVPLSGGLNDATTSKPKSAAALDVTDGLNPDSSLIPVTRIEGITRAAVMMSGTGSMWRGQGALIHMGGGRDLVMAEKAFIHLNIANAGAGSEGGSRVELWPRLRKVLDGARPKEGGDDDKKPDAEKAALARLFDGSAKLVVTANRASDIRAVIALKADYGFDVILHSGHEAWREAEGLAAAGIPVIVNATDNLPGSFESLAATQANAGRLEAAGVKVAFTGAGSHNARLMPQRAGNAVANGMSWEAAMAGMTTVPAEMFGVGDRYGRLASGYIADVVVWDGDPIELMSAPLHVVIAGEEISLESRQTRLADRYVELVQNPALKR